MSRLQAVRSLQKQLSEAYAKPSTNKLTDRNVADLLVQLIQDGDIELFYTVDGLEYVTPRQLWKEIEREVAIQGGRRTIFGFQTILSVDAVHVERMVHRNAIHFSVASSTYSQHKIGSTGLEPLNIENQPSLLFSDSVFYIADTNELINGTFNTNLAMMLSEQLRIQGIVNLQEIASRYSLPYSYIEKTAKCALLNQLLSGSELDRENKVLVTEKTKQKFVSILRSALCACTRPVTIQKLLLQHPGIYYTSSLVNEAIQLLSPESLGTFEQKSRETVIFYPQLFLNARSQWISSSLSKELFISNKDLAKLGFSNPQTSDFASAVFILPFSVISNTLVLQLESAITEASQENQILELSSPLIPEKLDKIDVKEILNGHLSSTISQLGRLVNECYFVPNGLLTRCSTLFEQFFAEKAQLEAVKADSTESLIISPTSAPAPEKLNVNLSFVLESVRKWCPDQRRHELAMKSIAEILLPQVQAMVSTNSKKSNLDSDKSTWKKVEWLKEFEPLYLNVVFFMKNVESLPAAVSPDQRTQLLQYVLETIGKDTVKKLREACVMKYLVGTESEDNFKIFPSEVAKPLELLFDLTCGREKQCSLRRVSKYVQEVLQELGCDTIKLDEKTKEKILNTHRSSAVKQLQTVSEPSTRLRLCLSLIHSNLTGTMLLTSAKHVNLLSSAISAIAKDKDDAQSALGDDSLEHISAAYASLLGTIRAKKTKDAEAIQQAQAEFISKMEPLMKLV